MDAQRQREYAWMYRIAEALKGNAEAQDCFFGLAGLAGFDEEEILDALRTDRFVAVVDYTDGSNDTCVDADTLMECVVEAQKWLKTAAEEVHYLTVRKYNRDTDEFDLSYTPVIVKRI